MSAIWYLTLATDALPPTELFGDDLPEKDDSDDEDDEGSTYSGTPMGSRSSSRAGSRTPRRSNSSTGLIADGGGQSGLLKKMFASLKGKHAGSGSSGYTQVDDDRP